MEFSLDQNNSIILHVLLQYSKFSIQFFDHMEGTKCIDVDKILNWDDSDWLIQKNYDQLMVEAMERYLDEWQIRDYTYSAIAALASMGFLPRTKILMQYFHNIQSFIANLEHLLLSTSVGLFVNTSVREH